MRVPGYCTECHRIRQVRVSGAGMAMLAVSKVATGVCWECEEREAEARKMPPYRRR